ncbi:MAG: bifunctional aminoglycoside phosphotransferase/ATP-binding protein, partial [Acidimicrobiia bacterium]
MTEPGVSMADPAASVVAPALHETHVSIVFLVGDRAAKLKKPVRFPFVDLSTREARERICHREIELNRRLAPDVYLGVFDLVGPDGSPYDHLVMMRRMPDDRRLSTLVGSGTVPARAIRDLAHLLASFHGRADTSDEIAAAGTRDAVGRHWETGFAEIRPFLAARVERELEDEIEMRAHTYLEGRERLFDLRIELGRIRDGHGDLLADDVFLLDDGPRVLDCLEFDDELRYADVLADVAFLAMDLERLGSRELADRLLALHREYTGDSYPTTLAHHYIALRAHIRAKVAALRSRQGDASAAAQVDALLSLTAAHLRRAQVTLTLVGGAPGTGKSTLAAGLANTLGRTVLRSDEVRMDLAGIGHLERAATGLDRGIYSERHTRDTYRELIGRAGRLLELGEPVLLDASWAHEDLRAAAREVAAAAAADLIELCCTVDPETAARRMSVRSQAGNDPSDATPEVGNKLRQRFDPWPGAAVVDV